MAPLNPSDILKDRFTGYGQQASDDRFTQYGQTATQDHATGYGVMIAQAPGNGNPTSASLPAVTEQDVQQIIDRLHPLYKNECGGVLKKINPEMDQKVVFQLVTESELRQIMLDELDKFIPEYFAPMLFDHFREDVRNKILLYYLSDIEGFKVKRIKYQCKCGFEVEQAVLPNDYTCPDCGAKAKEFTRKIIYLNYFCTDCSYKYDSSKVAQPFETLLSDWTCPSCQNSKDAFLNEYLYNIYKSVKDNQPLTLNIPDEALTDKTIPQTLQKKIERVSGISTKVDLKVSDLKQEEKEVLFMPIHFAIGQQIFQAGLKGYCSYLDNKIYLIKDSVHAGIICHEMAHCFSSENWAKVMLILINAQYKKAVLINEGFAVYLTSNVLSKWKPQNITNTKLLNKDPGYNDDYLKTAQECMKNPGTVSIYEAYFLGEIEIDYANANKPDFKIEEHIKAGASRKLWKL